MAKKLSTQTKLKRLRAEGYSRKDLARSFGVSISAIGRAERGATKGATLKAQADQFYGLGKRAKASVVSGRTSLPSAPAPKTQKARRVKVPVVVTPLERAAGKLSQYSGDTKVVVYLSYRDGSRQLLYARGGIEAGDVGDLGDAIKEQAGSQYRSSVDFGEIVDIDVEEY